MPGLAACAMLLGISAVVPSTAGETDAHALADATAAMSEFIARYRIQDYRGQWGLLDPRMRKWITLDRWRNAMTLGRRRHGELAAIAITSSNLVRAEQLPCTEMGHCYRRGVPYALFIMRTRYVQKDVPQPEFVVMSHSIEGWRFAGGTFPVTSLGETAVLLDEADEARYRSMRRRPGP